jgi:hypothetical protein
VNRSGSGFSGSFRSPASGLNSGGGVPIHGQAAHGQLATGASQLSVVGTPASAPLSGARAFSPNTKGPCRAATGIAGVVCGAKEYAGRICATVASVAHIEWAEMYWRFWPFGQLAPRCYDPA